MCDRSAAGGKKHLPVDLDYIPDDLKIRAKTELFEDEETKNRSLKELREMLSKEEGLCWLNDDLFLLSFLRARKFDVNRAFALVKAFYTCLGKRNGIYYRLSFDRLRELMKQNAATILPHRDHDGNVVFIFRYAAWDPDYSSAEENIVCYSLSLLQALHSPATQIAGFKGIIDFKGFNLKHLMNSTPSVMFFIAELVQSSIPMRVKKIHIVNDNYGFQCLYKILRPFLSKKLQERFILHGKDLKGLHESVPPCILPADYGGELPPFENSDCVKRLEASADYIEHILSFGYEQSLNKYRRKKSLNNKLTI